MIALYDYRETFVWVRAIAAWCLLSLSPAFAQNGPVLTIETCYEMAREHYPLVRQKKLFPLTAAYTLSNLNKSYLPALGINGQASYQSAVTSFPFTLPIAGFELPVYSKDQYKIYAEADQAIYQGGSVKNQKKIAMATMNVQEQQVEVGLYDLYDRVDQLYLGILWIDGQVQQNQLLREDLQNGLDKARALVENGMAYRSQADELYAQLLQSEQDGIELMANRAASFAMLCLMTGLPPEEDRQLVRPEAPPMPIEGNIRRPELLLYTEQQKLNELGMGAFRAQLRPRIGAFLQGGYGRPGLNMLSNDFSGYYIGGLRLSWSLGGWYTFKNQKKMLDIEDQKIKVDRDVFLYNTRIAQRQQYVAIQKYNDLLRKDDAIIELRKKVKQAASAQLENGVLTAHDYIVQVHAEDMARKNRLLHEIQLLQARFSYLHITGTDTLP